MRWFLLSLALIFGTAQSQEQPKPKATQQKSKTELRGSEKAPLFIKTPSPATQAERDYETYEKNQKPWNETALVYATIALAVITLALAVFTALLWTATYHLVREAKDTAKRQLRAYVGLDSHALYFDETTGRPKMALMNYGNTPASNLLVYRRVVDGPPAIFDYPTEGQDHTQGILLQGSIIFPKQRVPFIWLHDRRFMEGRFVYGYIDYTDIFKTNWRCRFAYQHTRYAEFVPHHEHNYEQEIT